MKFDPSFIIPSQIRYLESNDDVSIDALACTISSVESLEIEVRSKQSVINYSTNLTLKFIYDSIFEEIERTLTITRIYHLEIFEKEISISILIRILNLLSQIITLKVHSILTDGTTEITFEEFHIFCSMKEKSKITKVYLKQIDNIEQLDFIFELCPYMEYFKVGFINLLDIQLFFHTIFNNIKYNNHHPNSLCLNIPTADDKILEDIKETIKYENLSPPFIIKRVLDNVYLKWK
ncbi:unnamed protein product [Rotaria sordida]|uniref:Uncharacterized protein n=2 Tax=Rotaria sordida TaxID=392033 RepID=A0A814U0Q2_9BILA|nr:unnamed protein product [Rotaria sordida]